MGELGTWLVRAREARGLTLEDAERDTRISRRYLQALESEQFEIIPAPVYARGFLRSYSQYLGLDPQEMLAIFPREDDFSHPPGSEDARASKQQPLAPVSASRPQWQRQDRSIPPRAAPTHPSPPPAEPVIGIDIGVPVPARRMQADPAAQTRALTVLVIAVGGVVAVMLLALLISRLGDDGTPPDDGGSLSGSATQTARAGAEATSTGEPAASRIPVTPGIVPNVTGEHASVARVALQEAGYTVKESSQKDSQASGIVLQQSPAAGVALAAGLEVRIVVSGGP